MADSSVTSATYTISGGGGPDIYQAEDATYGGGCTVDTAWGGYDGTG